MHTFRKNIPYDEGHTKWVRDLLLCEEELWEESKVSWVASKNTFYEWRITTIHAHQVRRVIWFTLVINEDV